MIATAEQATEHADELDAEVHEARRPLRPRSLEALAHVRDNVRQGACTAGQRSARDDTDPPEAQSVIDFVVAAAEAETSALAAIPGWEGLVDTSGVAERVALCRQAEVTVIEEEAHQGALDACAGGDIRACTLLSQAEVETLCTQGSSEACYQANGPLTTAEADEKIAGANCRWRFDATIPGYYWNLDTGQVIINPDPGFNPC